MLLEKILKFILLNPPFQSHTKARFHRPSGWTECSQLYSGKHLSTVYKDYGLTWNGCSGAPWGSDFFALVGEKSDCWGIHALLRGRGSKWLGWPCLTLCQLHLVCWPTHPVDNIGFGWLVSWGLGRNFLHSLLIGIWGWVLLLPTLYC